MVGHKYNLKELEQDLQAAGISHTTTEFCQGRVTRWGLAWTYQDYDLAKLVPARTKPRKKHVPVVYLLSELSDNLYDIDNVTKKIKKILEDLQIAYHIINKRGNSILMDIKALTNTWSNQRRKKRQMKKLEEGSAKKPKLEELNIKESESEFKEKQNNGNNIKIDNTEVNSTNQGNKCSIGKNGDPTDKVDFRTETETLNSSSTILDNLKSTNSNLNTKPDNNILESIVSEVNTSSQLEPVVHAFLKIIKKDKDILLEMEFLNGSGGKEGLHQIVQYIKNNCK